MTDMDIRKVIAAIDIEEKKSEEERTWITSSYRDFVKNKGEDIRVKQVDMSPVTKFGPGKNAVHNLLVHSISLVENMVRQGVPEEVALKLLPQEIYEKIEKEDSKRNRFKRNVRKFFLGRE